MTNPYIILGIKETATNAEIKEALKKQINTYCGLDDNAKDINGYYLKESFYEAANSLLDKEKRKQIDLDISKIKTNHELAAVHDDIYVTYINNEYIKMKINFHKNESLENVKKISSRHLYTLFGADGSVLIANEFISSYFFGTKIRYQLRDVFTDQYLTNWIKNCPWDHVQTFDLLGGVPTMAIIGSKIIPVDIIDDNGFVSRVNLAILKKYLVEYCRNHPETFEKVFKK